MQFCTEMSSVFKHNPQDPLPAPGTFVSQPVVALRAVSASTVPDLVIPTSWLMHKPLFMRIHLAGEYPLAPAVYWRYDVNLPLLLRLVIQSIVDFWTPLILSHIAGLKRRTM